MLGSVYFSLQHIPVLKHCFANVLDKGKIKLLSQSKLLGHLPQGELINKIFNATHA